MRTGGKFNVIESKKTKYRISVGLKQLLSSKKTKYRISVGLKQLLSRTGNYIGALFLHCILFVDGSERRNSRRRDLDAVLPTGYFEKFSAIKTEDLENYLC